MPARLKPWLRRLRHLAALLIITFGVLSSLAYLLTPLLADWRDDLARYASEQLGRPVSIGGLQARWRGLGPALRINDLALGDPNSNDCIRLDQVDLDVGLFDMLLHRNLSPLRVTLHRLRILLVRETDGSIRMAGLNQQQTDPNSQVPFILPDRLRLRDIELIWEDRKKGLPPLKIPHAQLDLDNRDGALQLAAKMSLDEHRSGEMVLVAELDTVPWQADWSGRIYLQLKDLSSELLSADYLPAPYRLHGVARKVALWSDWRRGQLLNLQGQLDLPDLTIVHGERRIRLSGLRGDFQLGRLPRGWALRFDRFSLSHRGISWPSGQLELVLQQDPADNWQVTANADYLRVQDLVSLYQVHPSDPDLSTALAALDPQGELHQLQLSFLGGDSPRWQIASQFNDLGNKPWQSLPAIRGLSGSLSGDQDGLRLQLDSQALTLTLPKAMRHPIQLQRLRGELRWQPAGEQGWQLESEDIIAYNKDIYTHSRVRLESAATNLSGLEIDLQTDFRDARPTAVPDYLPTPIMGDKLVAWLDQAFAGGHIPSGTVLLLGPLRDFPYHKTHSGHFEVLFGIEDLQVDYRKGWPPLTEVIAELRFHNNDLDIALDHGRIYDSEILQAHGRISPLNPTGPLRVRGKIRGPLQDNLRLLSESPLHKDFGNLAGSLKGVGQSQLQLDFSLGLDKQHKDSLDGKLRFLDAGLRLPAWDLNIDQLQGELAFDLDGVHGQNLRGVAFGDVPLSAEVAPGADGLTWINARSRLSIEQVRKRLPELPLKPLSGSGEFDIGIGIAGRKARNKASQLVIKSDLTGIGIDLPPPLAKTAAQARPFRLEMPLLEQPVLHLSYGDFLDARFTQDGRRSAIRFGGGPAKLAKAPGLHLSGHLPELDLSPWLALQDSGAGRASLPPLTTDLTLGHLGLGSFGFDNIRLGVRETEQGWDGSVAGSNFTGRFLIPTDPRSTSIRIDLQRLGLHFDPAAPAVATAPGDHPAGSPRNWPALDLRCDSLLINDRKLGRLDLQLRKSNEGVRIAPLTLKGKNLLLQGELDWATILGDDIGESQLRGTLDSKNFGALLQSLGFSEQLQKGEAHVDLDLNWRGHPTDFSPAWLAGDLNLAIDKGVFVEVEPGVSRAFGLLNIGALQRRLRLDFHDLFGAGFSFDHTEGSFHFDKGDAYTNDLTIEGPSGVINIAGRTGLVKQDFDQLVTVTPELGAVLPLAVGTTAGPLAGVAVWVAQELASKQIDKINRFQYSVIGPWDNPEVKQLDTGGALSKLLKPVTGGILDGKNEQGKATEGSASTLFEE